MTIIYSNAEDIDCHVLRYAFENLKDVNLVEMNNLIAKKVKLSEWQISFGCRMDGDDEIDKFTRQGLYYYDRN